MAGLGLGGNVPPVSPHTYEQSRRGAAAPVER
jgi:hypothetical protein